MKLEYIIASFFLILCFTVCGLGQEIFTAKVVGVADGDTITVLTKDKRQIMLQLVGIDAPQKQQDFGASAHQFLSGLVLDQNVTISNLKKDCLDRLRASVAFNKKDLSLMTVKLGNAWADTSCGENELLVKEEKAAKEKKLGLWQNPNPTKPGEFDASKQPSAGKPTSTRRIYTGLAPAPPPPKNPSLHIGMTLEEFIEICGNSAKPSKITNTSTRQSFSVDITATPENIKKKCNGSFAFDRDSSAAPFKMWMAEQ